MTNVSWWVSWWVSWVVVGWGKGDSAGYHSSSHYPTNKPPHHPQFIWASEQDGYSHLYIGDLTAEASEGGDEAQEPSSMVRLTGPGEYIVEDIAKVS